MKLSAKLLLSYLAVAFLVLLVGAGSYFLNKNIKDNLIEESQHSISEMQQLSDLGFHLQNSLLYTRNYLIEKTNERESSPGQIQFNSRTAEQAVRSHLNEFSNFLDSLQIDNELQVYTDQDFVDSQNNLEQLFDTLETSFQLYQSLLHELFDLEEEEDEVYGDEIFNLTIEPYFRTTLLPILEKLRESQKERVRLQMGYLQNEAESTAEVIVILTAIAFLIAILLAYFIYRSIAQPLKNLSAAVKEIGAGNLEKRIKINTHDELQRLGDSFNRMVENLNKSMVSREYVNNIIQSMGDMLIVTDPGYKIGLVNKATLQTLGYEQEEIIDTEIWGLFEDQHLTGLREKVSEMTGSSSFESKFLTKDGREIPVIISYSTLSEKQKGMTGIVFVASNITAQKEAEEKINKSLKEKEVLLAEIHHRVKNNLAVITGLLEMQVWNLEENDQSIPALKESQLRIQSIALVHELLYQTESFSEIKMDEYALKLLNAIEKAHRQSDKSIRVKTDLDPVRLTIQKAIPASLLLNELVVNAYKHAFDGRSTGSVSVNLHEKNEKIHLTVQDDGIGLPREFNPLKEKSLGMTLVKTLIQQINAELEVADTGNGESGTVFHISFKKEV
ncbi:MAG: histidine kinase dimerization/phosphoacceptor domain -containing protein [Balneolaceae bacterium]